MKSKKHLEKYASDSWKGHCLLAVFLLLFYLLSLSLRSLNVPDEGRYPSIALAMLQRQDYVSTMLNGGVFMDKPALYYWLEALSMHLFGVNEWSIRLPSALAGIWGALLTRHVATRLFDVGTGWLAGLILGTSLLYYIGSNYADMDLEVAVWISSSLFFSLSGLQEALGSTRRKYFYLAYMFAGLAFLTKGLMGIVFPAMILGIYSVLSRQWSLIKHIYLPTGLVIFLIICAPWYVLMQRAHPEFFNYFFIYQQFVRFTQSGFNSVAPFWFYVPIVFLGLFPWSLYIPLALKNAFAGDWKKNPCFYLGIWVVSIFIFFSIPGSKPVTYILPIFPPLAILIAKEMAIWLKTPSFSRIPVFILLLLATAIGLVSLVAGVAPRYLSLNVPVSSQTGLISLAFVMLLGCAVAFGFVMRRHGKGLLITVFTTLTFSLVLANILAGHFNAMGTKPLALYIKDSLNPNAQIINFRQYFYDLPLYLQTKKPLIVVDDWDNEKAMLAGDNWRSELYFGMKGSPEAKAWLVTPDKLGHLLDKPSWVFARKGSAGYLVDHYSLKRVAESGKVVLLSNMQAN